MEVGKTGSGQNKLNLLFSSQMNIEVAQGHSTLENRGMHAVFDQIVTTLTLVCCDVP